MKTIGLKLASLFLTLAMTATVLPLSAAAESETATDCTRSYTFDSADELNDFYSYWCSRNNTNGAQIKDNSVTDSFKLSDGTLVRTRTRDTDWEGKVNHITALTFKDLRLKNFDLSFSMKNDLDNSYAKSFFVGVREVLPGQPASSIYGWTNGQDSVGNTRNDIYINNYGGIGMNAPVESGSGESVQGQMKNYRLRAVGTTLQFWKYDTTKAEPDATLTLNSENAGTISLCFGNTNGALDNISITNLDDSGNAVPMPAASTKVFAANAAAKGAPSEYYRELMTESWYVDNVYNTYSGIDSDCFNVDDYGNMLNKLRAHTSGVSADNMTALTLNEPALRNFEATFLIKYMSVNYDGGLFINMREQIPGKAFANTYSQNDMWPTAGRMSDGSNTVVFNPTIGTGVYVWNGSGIGVTEVGSKTSDTNFHIYRLRLVGSTLESWIDGTQCGTVEGLDVKNNGYLSVIAANCSVAINSISVTWLDEDGNEAAWGTKADVEPEVDSTREWFGGKSNELSEFRSSYWSKGSGYTSTDSIDGALWKINEWNTLENKRSGEFYDNDWSNGAWADNMTAVTLNDNSFADFEVTAQVKGLGQSAAVMISTREKTPGQAVAGIGSWSFGTQPDGSENVVLKYFTNDGNAMIHSGSSSASVGEGLINGTDWNILKLRVVGNKAETWVNGTKTAEMALSDKCEKQGYISVIFANQLGALNRLTVTRLDSVGNPIDYTEGKQLFIKSLNDMNNIGKALTSPADGNYFLTDDIALGEGETWTEITGFKGSFDGQGHKITGINKPLFTSLEGNATVKNLVIENAAVNTDLAGAVAGVSSGENVSIRNVAVVNGSVSAAVGGAFLGSVTGGKTVISDCSYSGYVGANYLGVFIGAGGGAKVIKNCYVNGKTEGWEAKNNITLDNAAQTENVYIDISGKKPPSALGLSEELWIHDGRIPQLKITGKKAFTPGDANMDANVDVLDLIRMKKAASGAADTEISYMAANLDGELNSENEAEISASDISALKKILLSSSTDYEIYDARLYGKSALFLGDSIAYGANDTPVGYSWSGRIAKTYGMKNQNVGCSGWYVTNHNGSGRIVNEFNNAAAAVSSYDFVILHGGVNDVWHSKHSPDCAVPLGALSDEGETEFDNTTFYGALEEYVTTAKKLAPNAKIGYIINADISNVISSDTSGISFDDMVMAIKEVCDKYGVAYLDLPENTAFSAEFSNTSHLADGVHPTAAGYDILSKYIADWMKTL